MNSISCPYISLIVNLLFLKFSFSANNFSFSVQQVDTTSLLVISHTLYLLLVDYVFATACLLVFHLPYLALLSNQNFLKHEMSNDFNL